MATSLARGSYSFITFRSLLGLAESGNWPGATKAVSEWFRRVSVGWRGSHESMPTGNNTRRNNLQPFVYSSPFWPISNRKTTFLHQNDICKERQVPYGSNQRSI